MPDYDLPPKKGTKAYKKYVDRGCGFYSDEYNGDGYCEFDYPWPCDVCPCVINKNISNQYSNIQEEIKDEHNP